MSAMKLILGRMNGLSSSKAVFLKPFNNFHIKNGMVFPMVRQISTVKSFTPSINNNNKPLFSIFFKQHSNRLTNSLLGKFTAVSIAALLINQYTSTPIKNDIAPVIVPVQKPAPKKKITYQELTYGSIFGLFLGLIIGKLSYVLAALTFTGFLALEFLENHGIITIPWKGVVKFGKERVDVNSLFFDNVSFKLSFFLSFFIAAWNV